MANSCVRRAFVGSPKGQHCINLIRTRESCLLVAVRFLSAKLSTDQERNGVHRGRVTVRKEHQKSSHTYFGCTAGFFHCHGGGVGRRSVIQHCVYT